MKENIRLTDSSKLTFDQDQALKAFCSWLARSEEKQPFVLSGFAGSGKTFLSTRLLNKVDSLGFCWTVVAPTHKAVGVLRQTLETEGLRPTWFPSTIHRLLRLKLKRKGALEVCERTDQTQNSLEKLGLVLIDEASMIDSNLLEIVLNSAHSFSTRLVFVGDPAQLPPIGESVSPVFGMQNTCKAHLKEVVRHQGSVLKLASGIRDGNLPSLPPPCFGIIKTEQGVVGALEKKIWLDKAKESLLAASEQDNPDAARILCYTNRMLERLVPHARRAIHGDMADQLPVLPGEVLITRNAVMEPASLDGNEYREEPDILIGSNRELVVTDVAPECCDLADLGLLKEFEWEAPLIETLRVNALLGQQEFALRISPPVGSQSRKLLEETLNRLRSEAKSVQKNESRVFWRKFFLVRDAFACLGPASVLTVHRSQGSTFGEVFVAPDVFWPEDLLLRKQLLYVAVSRASKGVWLAGSNANLSLRRTWEDNLKL